MPQLSFSERCLWIDRYFEDHPTASIESCLDALHIYMDEDAIKKGGINSVRTE